MKKLGFLVGLVLISTGLCLAQTTIFSDDMTSFPTGWTLSPSAGWTISSSRYNSSSYSARVDDVNPYLASQNNYMTRSVSLSGYTSATMTFYIWQYTESSYDYVYLQYYSGSTWTTAWSRSGSYQSWAQQSATIPTTATQIRFWFKSDGSVQYEGAYIDDVVLTASGGTTTQNDAGSGGDAGGTFATALQVSPGSWTGCYLDATDREDYYKFNVTSGQVIKVRVTPPSSADYDLYLYNPSQTQVGSSTRGTGLVDSIIYTATVSGYFYCRAYEYSGTGNYSLLISVSGTTSPALAVSMTSWAPAAAGGTSSAVNVTNSATTDVISYTVSSNQTWLTVSAASGSTPGSFTMTAAANTGASRSATVTVTATAPSGTAGSPKTITVTQAAAATPTLAISMTSWAPAAAGGTSSAVSVTNSGSSDVISYTVSSNQTWLTVSAASGNTPGSFTMTAAANTGSARTATVTVTATTGGVANSPQTIAVSQAAGGSTNPFKYICLKVGQGDAAVLVSPTGKIALIDGSYNNTVGTTIWKFLRDSIGTHHLDYIFTSHLHSDHIGGTDCIIDSLCKHGMDSIINGVYDRGGSYGTGTDYTNYNTKAGAKRRTAYLGQTFDLGGGLTAQVVNLKGKTISGDSVVIPSGEENGMSMGLLISYNGFKLISAGDIAGYNSGDYKNVESILAPDIGSVNVLHVNHHSSASSSNPTWVSTLNPQVSLISLGAGNSYGYPKAETITRLTSDPGLDNHIYQTETGTGGTIPSGRGHVCNSNIWIVVNSTTYTVWGESYSIAKDGELAAQEPDIQAVPSYGIGAVHPNPARGLAVIELAAPGAGTAELTVYNLLGQKVCTLMVDIPQLGSRQIRWDCRDGQGRALPNGVYLLRLAFTSGAGCLSSTAKVILMK